MTKVEGQTLEHVVPLLGHAYTEWKTWNERKDDYRTRFFELADRALQHEPRAFKVADISAISERVAIERAERHHPGFLIDQHRPHKARAGVWEFVLHEDPSLMPFEFEHEGIRYARQVSKGPVMLDEVWLLEEDEPLFNEVVFILPWGGQVVRPIEELEQETIGKLARYIYNGKPRVSLAAPRAVKHEERDAA